MIVITYRAGGRFHHRHKRDIRLRYVITCAHGVFFAAGSALTPSIRSLLDFQTVSYPIGVAIGVNE